MMRRLMFITAILIPFAGLAQWNSVTCKNEVKKLYQNLENLSKQDSDESLFHMHYTVVSYSSNPQQGIARDEINLWRTEGKQLLRGSQFTLLEDEDYSFMILPGKQKIFWSDRPEIRDEKSLADWGIWRLELIEQSELVNFQELENGEIEVSLKLPESLSRQTHLQTWHITFTPGAAIPSKIRMEYQKGFNLNRMTLAIHKCEWTDTVPKELEGRAVKQIFLKKGKLQPRYEQYELIDDHIQ